MNRQIWSHAVVAASVIGLSACTSDYSKEMRKSVERVLKADFGGYHFWATPVSNFGVGTMYLKSTANQDPSAIADSALIAISDTYFDKAVSKSERDALVKLIFPDGKIGSISLSEKLASGIDVEAALPNLAGMINLSGGIESKKDIAVEIHAGGVRSRRTNWLELSRAMKADKIAEDVKAHILAHDIMIAMNDIVLDSYSAKVQIKTGTNAKLEAALKNAALKDTIGDATAKLKVTRSQDGTYEVKVEETVVAAALFREIPAGVLSETDNAAESFPTVEVNRPVFERMRELVRQRLISISR